ncbi:hypothetical protein N7470_007566 [Penicillium chermesinum]|nr:hypothetical protein N7470_007566 [Penicillium chermesinum]
MRDYMAGRAGGETLDGLRSLAVNVIGQAGYSQKQPWSPQLRELGMHTGTDDRTAYFSTLSMIANAFVQAALVPSWVLRLPTMPSSIQTLGYHLQRIPEYTKSVLNEERSIIENESGARSNFLSLLVRLSDAEKRSKTGFSLTDEEISGNLFVFTTAGFETTANTMGYSVALLAAHPQYQDWLREELQGLDLDPTTWAYDDVFPKCKRTLAIMLETLRLFPPVLHSMRAIHESQQFVSERGTHSLFPPMDIFISQAAIHLDPEYWGPDPEAFRPTRWIDGAGQVITPAKGTFIPWSEGARMCPGMKMSQVEFVSTIATLFRSSKCEVLPTGGLYRAEDLQQRLKDLMADSVTKLTLQFRDPNAVLLHWMQDGFCEESVVNT